MAQYNQKGLHKREAEASRVREGITRLEAEVKVMPLLEGRPWAKEHRQPVEAGKGKGHDLPSLQGLGPGKTFILAL